MLSITYGICEKIFPGLLFWHKHCTAFVDMKDKTKDETIEGILNAFINEIQCSDFSRHLLSIYEELGIQP